MSQDTTEDESFKGDLRSRSYAGGKGSSHLTVAVTLEAGRLGALGQVGIAPSQPSIRFASDAERQVGSSLAEEETSWRIVA